MTLADKYIVTHDNRNYYVPQTTHTTDLPSNVKVSLKYKFYNTLTKVLTKSDDAVRKSMQPILSEMVSAYTNNVNVATEENDRVTGDNNHDNVPYPNNSQILLGNLEVALSDIVIMSRKNLSNTYDLVRELYKLNNRVQSDESSASLLVAEPSRRFMETK